MQDQALRAAAEVQNARRRAEEEVSKARKFAVESFAESLLPVIDSLEAGLAIKDVKLEQIKEGSEATLRQLKSALERNKVIAIDPISYAEFSERPFIDDKRFMQAVLRIHCCSCALLLRKTALTLQPVRPRLACGT